MGDMAVIIGNSDYF